MKSDSSFLEKFFLVQSVSSGKQTTISLWYVPETKKNFHFNFSFWNKNVINKCVYWMWIHHIQIESNRMNEWKWNETDLIGNKKFSPCFTEKTFWNMYFGTGQTQWWCDKIHRIKIFDQNDHVFNGSKNFLIEINVFFVKK